MFWRYLIALGIYGHVSTCLGSSDCVLPDHPAGGKWEVVKGKVGFPGDKVDSSTVLAYTCDGEIVPSYVVPCSSTVQVRCKGSIHKRGILDYFFGGDEEQTSTSTSRERPNPRQKPRPAADPYGSQLEIRGGRGGDGLVLEDGDRLGARNAVGIGGRGGDVVVRGWPDYGEPVEVRGGDGRTGVVASGDSTWGGSIVAVGGRGGDVAIDGNRRRPTKDRTIRRGGEISDGYHWSDQGDALVGVGGRGQDVRVRFARSTRQKRQKEIKLTQSKWTNGRSGTIKQSAYGRLDGPGTLSLRAEGHVSVGQDGVLVEGDVFGDADDDLPDWAKDLLNQNGVNQRRRRDTSKKGTSKSGDNGEGKDRENVRSNGKSVTGGDGGDGLVLKNDVEKTVEGRGGKGGDVKVFSKINDGNDDEPLTVVRGGKGGHGIIIRGDPIVGGVIRATGGRGGDATLTSSKDSKASKASKASKDSTKGHKQDSSKGHKQDSSKGRKHHDDEKKEEDAKEKSTKQTRNGQQGTMAGKPRQKRQSRYAGNFRSYRNHLRRRPVISGDYETIGSPDGGVITKSKNKKTILGGVGLGGITEVKVHRGTDDDDYDEEYEDNEDERSDDRLNSAGRNNTKPNKKNQGGTRTSTNTRLGENCPVYTGDEYTRVSCYHNNRIIDCDKARSRSSFNYTCSPFCEPVNRTHETGYCFDGEWTVPEPKCVPICGKKRTNAQVLVVNGKTAVLNDYPWAAAVFKVNQGEEKNVCGGTMLTRRVVLTAAHCVTDLYGKKFDNDRIKVGLGKHYNEYQDPRDLTAQYSTVDQILTHKYYRGINQHYGNDIAMLVTTKRLDLSITVQPICFKNLPSFDLVNDMRGIVTGWGYTEQSGAPSVELKELFVPYKDNRACQADFSLDWLDDFLTGDKFCAGFTYKSTSVCKGDSGGGLMFPYNNRFYVQGIVSLGNNPSEGECQIQKSSLYTRVASHYDWIVEVTTQFN